MNILHTEASTGWGGQEIRILREAEGMRKKGYSLFFAVSQGAKLGEHARNEGFTVYEIPLNLKNGLSAIYRLCSIIRTHNIAIVNTHSSSDAWLGGIAARICKRHVIRTRHLSTSIRKGWNSKALYNWLADYTVTTCQEVAHRIREQANLPVSRCLSIPTGVNPEAISCKEEEVLAFRKKWGLSEKDVVIGTTCVLRSWKGISDFLQAARLLEHRSNLKWLIVGEGPAETYFQNEAQKLGVSDKVIFTGHLSNPYPAMAAMDVFLLLSTANEGVSQASLQAGFLCKPLITTSIGGLPEVCIEGKTGYVVPPKAPQAVAERVSQLIDQQSLREQMGKEAQQLVLKYFTLEKTLDGMETLYQKVKHQR